MGAIPQHSIPTKANQITIDLRPFILKTHIAFSQRKIGLSKLTIHCSRIHKPAQTLSLPKNEAGISFLILPMVPRKFLFNLHLKTFASLCILKREQKAHLQYRV